VCAQHWLPFSSWIPGLPGGPRVMCACDSTETSSCDTVVNVHESVKGMCYGTNDSCYEKVKHACI
jgi:hypothetical protein